MRKITLAILLVSTLAVSSCKKSSTSAQSIVGTWVFSNIGGTYVNNTNDTTGSTTNYSFNNDSIISSEVYTVGSYSATSHSAISVTTETWTFNTDGAYTINEVYDNGGGSPITTASTGTWYYLNTTKPNQSFQMNGQASLVLSDVLSSSPTLYNADQTGNTLVLTFTNSLSGNTGAKDSTYVTLTFTKS